MFPACPYIICKYLLHTPVLCTNILEDQAQWCGKTKGLSSLVILNNAWVIDGWMKLLGNIKYMIICFRHWQNETIFPCNLTLAGHEFRTVDAATEKAHVRAFVFTQEM